MRGNWRVKDHPVRVGVAGHSGRGGFGHGLDVAFTGLDEATIVAVSDPDPVGRAAAQARSGATAAYAGYEEMLDREALDILVVAQRHCENRLQVIQKAVEAGVKGIFSEKPLAPELQDADAIVDSCAAAGVRLAVAHRRANAYELHALEMVRTGQIGELRRLIGHGKGDKRSGAEDLAVLGVHILDSIKLFADSDVAWVSGNVTLGGKGVTVADAREGSDGTGLLAGDGLTAYFAFENGVTAEFSSYPNDRPGGRALGFEVYGTTGILTLRDSPNGELWHYPYGTWLPGEADGRWERVILPDWEYDEEGQPRTKKEKVHLSNQLIARELLAAVLEDRELHTVSTGKDAQAVLEMIMAVHVSQLTNSRVQFPLSERRNPYRVRLEQPGSKPRIGGELDD